MNKQRRKELSDISDVLNTQRDLLEFLRDDEQMSYDNLPEGVQMSDRGDAMMEAVDALDEAVTCLEEAIEHIDDASK